ncbi:Suppressor APC domain-containing protein 2 [Trichinella pseudospiralis]|uniref:Suppressor APC domain-containing protein 2 n=1 Tax=Trichinella pseudospiralis TaxID=6337 RepID=A0A0V1F7E2_TRIPS|nr:Suppressor APC domain-containing protein 2 [Trichinella pseudospiralis]
MNWRRFGKKSTPRENTNGVTGLPAHLQQQLKRVFDECDTDGSGFVEMESFRQRCLYQLQQQQANGKSTSRADANLPWNRFIDQLIICTPTSGVLTLERCYAAMRAALTDFKSNLHSKAASNSLTPSNVDNTSQTKSRPAYSMTDHRQLRWSSYHHSEQNGNVQQTVQAQTSSARSQNCTPGVKIFTLNETSPTDCPSNNYYPPSVVSIAYSRPVSSIGNGNVDSDYGSIMSYEGVRLRDRTALCNGNGRKIVDYNRRRTIMVPDGSSPSNLLKQNQLMEEELSILEQGQDKANRLINWYHERLSALKTRKKLMGRSIVTLELAVHEEKLNLLRSQVSDLNRRIVGLMESSEKGFPSAANLANVGRKALLPEDDQHLWLKKQNQLLTEEVTDKTRRLAKLEQEKTKLIQLLFQKNNNNHVNQCNAVSSTPVSNGCLQNSKFVSMDAIQATLM